MADPETYRVRLATAIALAIADASTPEGETTSAIVARATLEALIANMALILAASPSVATPKALRAYCRQVAERLRGETVRLQADPNLGAVVVRRETLKGKAN